MKKIGVLTFHRPINYGAFLQCYSLTERIKSEFSNVEVEVIDYERKANKYKEYKNILKAGYYSGLYAFYADIAKYRAFAGSVKTLPLSPVKITGNGLSEVFAYMANRYDAVIVGSDAIFNWNQTGFPNAYLINHDFGCPKLSYAASVHGMRYREMTEEQRAYCSGSFSNYSFIGVRDRNTEEFVKYCNESLQPVHTCDPTVFLDMKLIERNSRGLEDKLKTKYGLDIGHKPVIAVMLQDDGYVSNIKEYFGDRFTIVSLFKYNKSSDKFLYDLNPYEWARFFSYASVLFTEYFHGTLLCLKNGTPVIAVDNSGYNGVYEGKLRDLLYTRFDLPDFYYTADDFHSAGSRIYEMAQRAINGEFNEKILHSVEKEAKTAKPFFDVLRDILEVGNG